MTIQIAIRLPEGMVEDLDGLVESGEVASRTEAVRSAVDAYLADHRRRRIDAALVRGYREHPPGGGDDWGDLEGQLAASAGRAARELDETDGGW